jgi:hypothetical protein
MDRFSQSVSKAHLKVFFSIELIDNVWRLESPSEGELCTRSVTSSASLGYIDS